MVEGKKKRVGFQNLHVSGYDPSSKDFILFYILRRFSFIGVEMGNPNRYFLIIRKNRKGLKSKFVDNDEI